MRSETLLHPSAARVFRDFVDSAIARVAPALLDCYDLSMSPTVFRHGAFRFFFFSREEPRMHVHVAHTDGEAKFWQDHYEEITHAWHSHFGY